MTPLEAHLRRRIAAAGPITIADYMTECLFHPKYGYYATSDPLGAAGDFTTAPEISQMFGELLGLALAQAWLDQGRPAPFCLAELGPGRGTLMVDLLRAAGKVPGFVDAAELHLVEASPILRRSQSTRLSHADPVWHDHVEELPQAPLFLVANEFFDALPIRQFQRRQSDWAERKVGIAEGALGVGVSGPVAPPKGFPGRMDVAPDLIVETCPAAEPIVATVAQRITQHGGAALIIDYGDWAGVGDTLQAVQNHKSVGILMQPGEVDLTAHVDFAALARAAKEAAATIAVSEMITQGIFLERLGISARAEKLASGLSGAARASHIAAHRRLTHPDEMGTLFKVIGFAPPSVPALAGLQQ
ncbi:MAG: SAM-dependent methyltransferase [Pseudomonadota bacterium]